MSSGSTAIGIECYATAPEPARSLDSEPMAERWSGLEIAGLGKSFGSRPAIQNVNFRVRRGEFVAVLGPSGAGKTTLFRCMTGLTQPDQGTVRLDGEDIRDIEQRERREIAVIFQQFNLISRLTALQNVLAGRLGHVPTWRAWTRRFTRADQLFALQCLERVGLLPQASQRADTLSGGQQQRVAVARALAQRPAIIVADEPVASLDPQSSAGVLDLLRNISRDDNVALVCSLHQIHLAEVYADRIVGLLEGRIVIDVPVKEFDKAAADRVYGESLFATP